MHKKTQLLWLLYAFFVGCALYFEWHEDLLSFSGGLGLLKLAVWMIWLAFLVYSIHCSRHENLMRTIRTMMGLYWGRQIGIDLYLGLLIALVIIFLHQGLLVAALWLLPLLIFANLATLLYLAIHFDALVMKLM
ncbi:MAG: hypothetical protein AAF351_01235 [Pseudomonadota bacterium]